MCQYTRLTSSFQINWSLNCILEQRGIPPRRNCLFQIVLLCILFPPKRQASPYRKHPLPVCFRSDMRHSRTDSPSAAISCHPLLSDLFLLSTPSRRAHTRPLHSKASCPGKRPFPKPFIPSRTPRSPSGHQRSVPSGLLRVPRIFCAGRSA